MSPVVHPNWLKCPNGITDGYSPEVTVQSQASAPNMEQSNCISIFLAACQRQLNGSTDMPIVISGSPSAYIEHAGQIAVATVQSRAGLLLGMATPTSAASGQLRACLSILRDQAVAYYCRAVDMVNEVPVTLIDKDMSCLVVNAEDVGITGNEDRDSLDANEALKATIEVIRLAVFEQMNLGDVADKPVPKNEGRTPQKRPRNTVRSFSATARASVDMLGAVSVVTACLILGSPAADVSNIPAGSHKALAVDHPLAK